MYKCLENDVLKNSWTFSKRENKYIKKCISCVLSHSNKFLLLLKLLTTIACLKLDFAMPITSSNKMSLVLFLTTV